MRNTSLVNTWIIIKREYLERVRQRSFIVLTLLLPAIMVGAFLIPAKLSSMKSDKTRRLVVVTSTPQFGEIVRQQLMTGPKGDEEKLSPTTIKIRTPTAMTSPAATMPLK